MKYQKGKSLYALLGQGIHRRVRKNLAEETIRLHETVRNLREAKGLSGVSLCRIAGDLDPKTLTAVEKGRIKNPSVKTLQSIARGLGVTVSNLFRDAEMNLDRHFYEGSQKGVYKIDFPRLGLQVISFTPLLRDFFCGKFILAPQKRLDETLLKHPLPIWVSTLVGRFEMKVEQKKIELKEGESIFFNGILRHSFYNPLQRESVLMLVTAPSFFK